MEENLAVKLCLLLDDSSIEAVQWKLLGQEKDGSLLLGWIENIVNQNKSCSVIGKYDPITNELQVLYKFPKVCNLVQASINQYSSLLGYVIKKGTRHREVITKDEDSKNTSECTNDVPVYYQAFLVEFKTEEFKIHILQENSINQIRLQFLYKQKLSKKLDKIIVLIHQDSIKMCTISYNVSSRDIKEMKIEAIVRCFIWAQWDAINQVLYHIHHKKPLASLFSDSDKSPKPTSTSPTLSGLQFHDNLPHETVLNIPLNLPQLPNSDPCGIYEDDVIPLRVHDCSLDLIVVSNSKGIICVCHHYLYRPVQLPEQNPVPDLTDSNTVHFAYSVTILHQSCVIHCVIPGIPWARAKLMRPTFALYGDHHMIVFVQGVFTHLLEIGLHHQPCCHILCGPLTNIPFHSSYLVPLISKDGQKNFTSKDATNKYSTNGFASECNLLTVDLPTLDLVDIFVSTDFLIDTFKKETSVEIRLAIIHFFFCHKNDIDVINELISVFTEKPRSLDIAKIMKEFLICGSHTLVQKNLLSDAIPLLSLIPVTTLEECPSFETKVNDFNITLSHEKLWNTSVMLLSPQQRLVPYQTDNWTRLWNLLSRKSDEFPRFQSSHIAEKLLVSLACYQPEALSRCTTPMSPSSGFPVTSATLGELMGNRYKYADSLPFNEMESCTASKQEHIVSVNLRELSLHLLKYGTNNIGNRYKSSCTPLQVHTMATKYVSAQLETSRLLCQFLCKAANVDGRMELERGFSLIDQIDDFRRWLLFTLLERYRYATESIAFPVPQGFMSFFTYLGYRTLKYSMFLQHVRHSVFELQVDVAKVIMADIGDSKQSVPRKLELLSLLPRTRAKRLLNQWFHPVSFMLRAREHSANILSGELSLPRNRPPQHRHIHTGVSAFPAKDRPSPLDTFFDLLTAKASLTELDFGLLIEATVTSTEDFL